MIAVIGGGPAGMMAAIAAKENGADVVIIEKNDALGKKLRITGKGRCNITNACPTEDIFENIVKNKRFLYSAIYSFSNFDTIDFIEKNGVPTKIERGERVFPVSDKAEDVVNLFKKKISDLSIKVIRGEAKEILIKDGTVFGVKTQNETVNCEKVILASGGKSYPKTGSDGAGYTLSKKAGHSVTKLYPALVPIETCEDVTALMGLSLRNVKITVKDGEKKIFEDFGEMLFTHYGVTGPIVLSSSSHMGEDPEGKKIVIDLKSALDEHTLDARILRDFNEFKNKDFSNSLTKLLPAKMIDYIVLKSGIDPHKKVNLITKEERKNLLNLIKNLTFTVKKYRPIDEAIVTSGGIDVREINASTMESKIVKNLYFAGEIIDTDAYTGGFNLQIAFSTGHLAGTSAAKEVE